MGYTGWVPGWVPGGWYTGYQPSRGRLLVLPGPNHCQTRAFCVHPGTPGPSRALRTPGLLALNIPLLEPNRARFHLKYPKVSINPECHLNSLMRPVIVPVSKTGLRMHDLEF